ncbi:hypothetical protein AY601_4064 [Pedobacter cryoconitis]|uniref:Uncharacterized protein n=1 Tax=Pedobacter cryoconitis TaxID=188932 RepID=A0A127VHW4_9SPHI|nr:hypothetical protein [Pedobacter cryoconitis]AMQ00915.1 hypothetical protein AY601_4064 [Pedobacter cryoconitis]
MEPFVLTLAENIHIDVVPAHLNGKDLVYHLFIDGKAHGCLIPYIDDNAQLAWRTDDNIDQVLVQTIGRMIDHYEQFDS